MSDVETIRFVLEHARFIGLAPASGRAGHYTIRISDADGHVVEIHAPLASVFDVAADALRRLP